MKINIPPPARDLGSASLDIGFGLLLLLVTSVTLYSMQITNIEEKSYQLEAKRITTWAGAARQYYGNKYAEIVEQRPTSSNPVCVTTQNLIDAGFLPDGFAKTNAEQQTLRSCVVTLKGDSNRLEGLVIAEGGESFGFKALRLIARDIRMGYGGYAEEKHWITGAQQAWKIDARTMGVNTADKGHVGVLLSADDLTAAYSSAREDADRLYRYRVEGRDELNAMQTDIDMSENDINNVGALNGGEAHLSGNVTAGGNLGVTGSGEFGQDVSAKGRVMAKRNITTDEEVIAKGNITGQHLNLAGATIGQSCYPNRAYASDNASGDLLKCEAGRWKKNDEIHVSFSSKAEVWPDNGYYTGPVYLGKHKFCALAEAHYDYNNYRACIISKSGDYWTLSTANVGNGSAGCRAICF